MERTMAVADPSRWQIVRLLEEEPRTVTQLAQAAGLSVAATCRHVQRLRAVGLVEAKRQGKELWCRPVSPETPIGRWLAGLRGQSRAAAPAGGPARVTVRAAQAAPPIGRSEPSPAPGPTPKVERPERPKQYRELEDYLL